MPNWNGHYCWCNEQWYDKPTPPPDEELQRLSEGIEPWLSALIQSEHIALLVGNGLTTAAAFGLGATAASMDEIKFGCDLEDKVNAHANRTATSSKRGKANMEDQLREAPMVVVAAVNFSRVGPGSLGINRHSKRRQLHCRGGAPTPLFGCWALVGDGCRIPKSATTSMAAQHCPR